MLLVTTAQMIQELDKKAMEDAGRGIFELICWHFAARSHQGVTILVGLGLCFMGHLIFPPCQAQKLLFKNS